MQTMKAGRWLLVLSGGGPPLAIAPLEAPLSVGRDPRADIVLEDPAVSRLHAQLLAEDDGWTLLDDGLSKNGTTVNGVRMQGRRRLTPGDRVVFGRTEVVFDDVRFALTALERAVLTELARPLDSSAGPLSATDAMIAEALGYPIAIVARSVRRAATTLGFGPGQREHLARWAAVTLAR